MRNYGLVRSVDELARFCDRLMSTDGPIGFDIETGYTGEDREKASVRPEINLLAGISFTNSGDWARYVPLAHETGENLHNGDCARLLWPLLSSGRGVAHNAAFELRNLSRWFMYHLADDPGYGEQVRATDGYFKIKSDTMVEAYLAAEFPSFALKPLVENLFGHKMVELHELFPELPKNRRKMMRFNILDPHDPSVYSYACEDSVWCLAVHQRYHDRVSTMDVTGCPCHPNKAGGLLYRTEMGVLDCVCEMEDFGVRYDWRFMREGAEVLRAFRDAYNAEIMHDLSQLIGQPTAVNLASPPQIRELLFTKLGMRTTRYTAKTRDLPPEQRKMSTDKIALERLAKQYPVVKKVTEWKQMTKLVGTYLEKYEDQYGYAVDGRTHPNHLSAFVVTGRFAHSDPNYAQSPKTYHYDLEPAKAAHAAHADAHGPKCGCDEFPPPPGTCFRFNFRDAICAPDEHYILGFDLSQAELRAIAGEAREEALLHAFATGQDVHTLTTALMLRMPIEQVDKDLRAIGKTMNFALLYGMGVKSLADRLAISVEEAQSLYDKYFQVYAGIADWSAKQVEHGKTYGYVVSTFGRRLPIWEYQSDKRWIRQKGDRACVNYPIQGSATGDYVKLAMVRARKALRDAGLHDRVHLVMNVHDALEYYVHRSVLPQQVIAALSPAVIIDVPGWPKMQADWHLGKRWGSLQEIQITSDGRFLVKGEKIQELVPHVEEDEESGEEVIILPDVDEATVRRVVDQLAADQPSTVATPQDAYVQDQQAREDAAFADAAIREGIELIGTGTRVIVELDEMPDEPSYIRFLELLASRPGPNTLTLRTPEGDLDIELLRGTDLHPGDLGTVSLLLGPARVYHDAADVAPGVLVADLIL